MQSCGGWRPVWGQFLTPQIPAWQLLWASVSPLQDSVTEIKHTQDSKQCLPQSEWSNYVPGWVLLLNSFVSHYLTLQSGKSKSHISVCQHRPMFPSQDVCLHRQPLQRCFNYFGRTKCNQHIF